ncbi:MAG: cytochrome C [Flavobacteriales bacterium]|nr:MAG: cytochrome C [Flavobacteriales bacterium]
MNRTKKILLGIVGGLLAIQLVPVDRTNPPVDATLNFTDVEEVPKRAEEILRNACYDCHSNETVYPNYAYVAPISWSIKEHVNQGRKYANFSKWNKYSQYAKQNIIKSSIREIQSGEMPMKGYEPYHPKAKLSKEDKAYIIDYLKTLIKN